MQIASISLGIMAYADPRLMSTQARLHFTTDDAYAFHRYVTAAWDGERDLHFCLTDKEADLNELEQAIEIIAAAGPQDLFLLYLSGHGEALKDKGWFCLADAQSGEPSLTSTEIDRLLYKIDADQILVIADFCYAETSLAGSRFFSGLEGRSSRIYIASARSDQKAWEDTELKRSILSDVLLKAIVSGSPLAGKDGMVDVETQLIPHLRKQVPLETTARKRGAVQEPVTGGLTVRPIRLPTVASRDMRRNLSISDTLRMRLRQILTVAALSVFAALIFLDLLIYHLAIGPKGEIMVRPGLSAIYALIPIHLGDEIDTGFSVSTLSPHDQPAFRRLSRGSIIGVTTRTDSSGLAPWFAQLEPMLISSAAARARMLARTETPQMESDTTPPIQEAAFVAYATATHSRIIADQVYPILSPIDVDCGRSVGEQLDFTLLDVPPDTFARDLAWRALRIEGPQHQSELIQLVTAVTYRIAHAEHTEQVKQDMEALAVAVKPLVSRSLKPLPN